MYENTMTVTFAGPRELEGPLGKELSRMLEQIVAELIKRRDFVKFVVSADGRFDTLAAYAVQEVRCELFLSRNATSYGYSYYKNPGDPIDITYDLKTMLICVPAIPSAFHTENKICLEYCYDAVRFCREYVEKDPGDALATRNRHLIEQADLLVCYVDMHADNSQNDAYERMKYANSIGKRVINLWKCKKTVPKKILMSL